MARRKPAFVYCAAKVRSLSVSPVSDGDLPDGQLYNVMLGRQAIGNFCLALIANTRDLVYDKNCCLFAI